MSAPDDRLLHYLQEEITSMDRGLIELCFGNNAVLSTNRDLPFLIDIIRDIDQADSAPRFRKRRRNNLNSPNSNQTEVINQGQRGTDHQPAAATDTIISTGDAGSRVAMALQRPLHRDQAGKEATLFTGEQKTDRYLDLAAASDVAYHSFSKNFPSSIWTCCASRCFQRLTSCMKLKTRRFLAEVLHIHETASKLIGRTEAASEIQDQASSRLLKERNRMEQRQIEDKYRGFVAELFPFLVGQASRKGITGKLCIAAVLSILILSLNGLYYVRRPRVRDRHDALSSSIVDMSCARQRQHRRGGSRKGFPDIKCLVESTYRCGCPPTVAQSTSCWDGSSLEHLNTWYRYREFSILSQGQDPRKMENDYLMQKMYVGLTNSVTQKCNRAIADLFTVSADLIGSLRCVLREMCDDVSLLDDTFRPHGLKQYRKTVHPVNRLPQHIRDSVTHHLHMVMGADPAGENGKVAYRPYSPEINTYEKLCKLLSQRIESEDVSNVSISPSTMKRMVWDFMGAHSGRLTFAKRDHNLCPQCKSQELAILTLDFEVKSILDCLEKASSAELNVSLDAELSIIKTQLDETARLYADHIKRDKIIRAFIGKLIVYFREKDRQRREAEGFEISSPKWMSREGLGLMTHQDDMSKIDIPYFFRQSMSDLARFRFDSNAHVNPITGNTTVFSHEQGCRSKKASSIFETILFDHLLTCRGENVKVVVSDCASVGRNVVTTIALVQYFVDQGLSEVVLVLFMENCHGKWVADAKFGQAQTRLSNLTVVRVDGLLVVFEGVLQANGGSGKGYALNPLASVNFVEVLDKLGYGPRDKSGSIEYATYEEPPFPKVEGTCTYNAMSQFESAVREKSVDPECSILEALRFVFQDMGGREFGTDEYLQRQVTIAPCAAVIKYKKALKLSRDRRSKFPKAIRTIRQFFKSDPQVRCKAQGIFSGNSRQDGRSLNDLLRELYEELESNPSEMQRYRKLVEDDEARFTKEIETYKTWLVEFDKKEGIASASQQI